VNELALFAGAGGGILGGHLLGWRIVCAVEWDAYAASVLVARQNDGCLPPFPVWDDVQTFDGRPWRGRVDVVSGGFPCTDISCAGKGAGIDGEASGMWRHMARIVGEVRPRFVLVENSPMLVGRGLARVLSDLAALGFDARWGVVGAVNAGAPHKRERIWILGYTNNDGQATAEERESTPQGSHASQTGAHEACKFAGSSEQRAHVADAMRERSKARVANPPRGQEGITAIAFNSSSVCNAASAGFQNGAGEPMGESGTDAQPERSDWWSVEPELGRVAHGVAHRVDRLRCIGNGQVPAVVRLAWDTLSNGQ
jgi:DNA (cytosine-5)-methyltransferase 1